MRRIRAYVLGVTEFRQCFTTAFDTDAEINAYDWGREIAHRLTLRRWDN